MLIQGSLTVDTPAGAEVDDFEASLFGCNEIVACLGVVPSTNDAVYAGCPDTTGGSLLIGGGTTSTTSITQVGTRQVTTATVIAAGGATGDGDINITVSSALFAEDEVVTVTLDDGVETTASLIAAAIRTALGENAVIVADFVVSGAGADIILTAKLPAANDDTLNIAIEAILGVTAVVTSVATTAGVAETYSTVTTSTGTQDLVSGTYTITLIGK
jgi:hypothetical protein